MLKEFAVWLVARVNALGASPALVIGGNVQVGFREQDAPVRCHTLIDTGGPADFDLPYRTDMMLQVMTRGPKGNFQQTRDDAYAIYSAIHGTSGWTIGPLVSGGATYRIHSITALAKPQYLGGDQKGNHEFSTNYLVTGSPN
ncbi:MAG: minor capsid protein [Candidatus Omnitrophota bacterium]|jgi:hypothetical protein